MLKQNQRTLILILLKSEQARVTHGPKRNGDQEKQRLRYLKDIAETITAIEREPSEEALMAALGPCGK